MNENTGPSILYSKITLEPMWMAVTMSLAAGLTTIKNFNIFRACTVDLNYSESECLHSQGTEIEKEAQGIVTSYNVVSTLAGAALTVIVFLLLGPWSDKSGRRKPLIMLSILGMVFASINMIILLHIKSASVVWIVYGEAIPLAIGGNYAILYMSSSNYLGDISFKTGRPIATLIAHNGACISAFMAISCIITPYMYRSLGFMGVFTACLSLEILALVYVIWRVVDVDVSENIPNVLNPKLPLEAIRCVFKKRPGHRRMNILLMIAIPCSNSMIDTAESAINYLYLRNKFSWTEAEFGYYMSMRLVIYTISSILSSRLSEVHKWDERYIGILSAISQISSSLLFMFSSYTWMVFTCNLLAIFSRGAMMMERKVLNKQIRANEQGSINSVLVVFEKFAALLCAPLVNYVYSVTLATLPSCYTFIPISAAVIQMIAYALVKHEPIHYIDDVSMPSTIETDENQYCITQRTTYESINL